MAEDQPGETKPDSYAVITAWVRPRAPSLRKMLPTWVLTVSTLTYGRWLTSLLLWGMLGWLGLGPSPARRWWTVTALGAVAALTALGLLTTFGNAGRLIVF